MMIISCIAKPIRFTSKAAKLSTLSAAVLLIQSNLAHADATVLHTIENIAKAQYQVNNDGSSLFKTTSNQVQAQTSAFDKYALSLSSFPRQTLAAGSIAVWKNTLTNTGLSNATVVLNFDAPGTLSNFEVYQDINKNGVIDDDDILITHRQIRLKQDESIDLLIQAVTDKTANDGDISNIKIGATVLEDPNVKAAVIDSLVIVTPSINFMNDDWQIKKDNVQLGNNVFVEASFAQCNANPNKPDQVWVTITSAKTKDKYSLKAIETGNNTGKYRLTASTENNANPINDNIIQTLSGDTLSANLEACIAPSVGLDETPKPSDLTYISGYSDQVNVTNNTPQLTIQKDADVKEADIGDYVNYTIKIKNAGAVTAYDVNLKDALPRGFSYVPSSVHIDKKRSNEFKADGKYQVLQLGKLESGAEKSITYRVLIGGAALGGDGINRAVATARDDKNNTFASLEAQRPVKVGRGVMNTDGVITGKVYHDINRDGIQQKQDGEIGVAGVRIYMENGNFAVTDSEGKFNFYGVSAKTHVLKVDRTTLPEQTELVTQSSRNAGDAGSRFVDLKYGELHRADFAIAGGLGDSPKRLNDILAARARLVNAKNDSLEQAVKRELALEPDYNQKSDNIDAYGCKNNDDLEASMACDSVIVRDMVSDRLAPARLTVNTILPPKEVELEEVLKNVSDNKVRFLNLSDNDQVASYKQLVQVQAPLGSSFTLFANNKMVPAEKIGKTAEQDKQKVTAFDYYAVELNRGRNLLRGVALDTNNQVISEKTITVIAPDSLQTIDYESQKQIMEADGISEYQVVIKLKDKENRPFIASTPITIDTNIGRINLPDSNTDQAGTQVTVNGSELLIPIIAPSVPGKGELIISAGNTKKIIPLQFTAKLRPLIAVGVVEGNISLKNFDSSNITSAQGAFEQELHEFSSSDDHTASGRAAMFLKGKVRGDYLLTLSYDSDKKGERLFRDIEPGEYYPVYGDASAKGFDAQSTSKLYVRLDKGRSFAMFGDLKTQIDNDDGIKLGQYNRTLTGIKSQFENDKTRITAFAAETSASQRVNETRGLGVSGPYPLAENFDAVFENSETVEVITRDADNPGRIIRRETLTRFADYDIDPISKSLYLKAPIASQDFDGNPIYLRVTVEVDNGGDKYWVGGVAAKQQLTKNIAIGGSYINSDDPLNKEALASINSVIKFNDKLKLIAEFAKNKAENPNYQASNQINADELTANDVKGDATRIELSFDDKQTRAKAYYNDADKGFVTGASPITAGRTESGIDITHKLANDKTALKLEGIYSKDHTTDASRQGILASVEQRLSQNMVGEIGVRHYKQEANSARNTQGAVVTEGLTNDTTYNNSIINQSALNNSSERDIEGTTARARITARLPKFNKSLVFAEYEQDLDHSSRNATSIGGETALGNLGRLYARHDLINSLSGTYGLDDTEERSKTVIGFDANYMKDGSVYSEYRARDAISAREAEAAIGLKNKWYVQKGLTLNTLLERIESLEGEKNTTSTAAGVGVEYLANDNYKASARFEKRWGDASDTLLGSAGIAYRVNEDITLLAKDIYSKVDYNDGHRTINRFQVGGAYRDADSNKLDMLSKLEYRLDDNATGNDPYQKDALIWSWSGNYHPTRPLTLSGHYAGKYTKFNAENIESNNTAHTVYGRGLYDLTDRWDLGLQAGSYWNQAADDVAYMLGAEVGYSPLTNLWLSLGYNFMGFQDDEIAYDDTTQEGAYFRLRFKFDEELFKRKP